MQALLVAVAEIKHVKRNVTRIKSHTEDATSAVLAGDLTRTVRVTGRGMGK